MWHLHWVFRGQFSLVEIIYVIYTDVDVDTLYINWPNTYKKKQEKGKQQCIYSRTSMLHNFVRASVLCPKLLLARSLNIWLLELFVRSLNTRIELLALHVDFMKNKNWDELQFFMKMKNQEGLGAPDKDVILLVYLVKLKVWQNV